MSAKETGIGTKEAGQGIYWTVREEIFREMGLIKGSIYELVRFGEMGSQGRSARSVRSMADILGLDRKTVISGIAWLEKNGWIEMERVPGYASKIASTDLEPSKGGNPKSGQGGNPKSGYVRHPKSGYENNKESNTKNNNTVVVSSSQEKDKSEPPTDGEEKESGKDLLRGIGIKGKSLDALGDLPIERVKEVMEFAKGRGYEAGWVVMALRDEWDLSGSPEHGSQEAHKASLSGEEWARSEGLEII